jgi:hypothetical protein
MPNRFDRISAAGVRAAVDAAVHTWPQETAPSGEGDLYGSLRALLLPFVVGCIVVLACLAVYTSWRR